MPDPDDLAVRLAKRCPRLILVQFAAQILTTVLVLLILVTK